MRKQPRRHGMVFIIAIIALAVMLIMGSSFLAMTSQHYQDVLRDHRTLHAVAAADAGISYMIWRQKWSASDTNSAIMPVTAHPALPGEFNIRLLSPETEAYANLQLELGEYGRDQATVWLFEYPINGISAYQIISLGSYQGQVHRVRGVLHGPRFENNPGTPGPHDPPTIPELFDYAFFSGTNACLTGNTLIDGKAGTNANCTLSGKAHVTGGLTAGGSVTVSGGNVAVDGLTEYGTTIKISGHPHITDSKTGTIHPFPTMDMEAWKAIAQANNAVIAGDLHVAGKRTFTSPVVYVKGDVHFSGQSEIQGPCTIVCEGDILMSGQVKSTLGADPSSVMLALMTPNKIKLSGQTEISAICYAHGVDNLADLSGSGQATIYGAIIADAISSSGQFTVYYRNPGTPVTPPSGGQDPTEGSSTQYDWNLVSWEML